MEPDDLGDVYLIVLAAFVGVASVVLQIWNWINPS